MHLVAMESMKTALNCIAVINGLIPSVFALQPSAPSFRSAEDCVNLETYLDISPAEKVIVRNSAA